MKHIQYTNNNKAVPLEADLKGKGWLEDILSVLQ